MSEKTTASEGAVNALVDVALFGAGTTYALTLNTLNDVRHPNTYWLEVVIGTALALLGMEARAALLPNVAAQQAVRWGWRSFAFVGAPIILWVFYQIIAGRYQRLEYQEQRHDDA
jgi:hypothetical protein